MGINTVLDTALYTNKVVSTPVKCLLLPPRPPSTPFLGHSGLPCIPSHVSMCYAQFYANIHMPDVDERTGRLSRNQVKSTLSQYKIEIDIEEGTEFMSF